MIECGSHKEIGTELESDCIDLDNKSDVGMSEYRLTVSMVGLSL